MDKEPLTLYKLMILYMLNLVDFPLTNSQVSQSLIEMGYTGYFNIQQALLDMVDTSLILNNTIYNSSYYSITHAGKETLESFQYRISDDIQIDIQQYIKKNKSHFRNENEITADYVKVDERNYRVICEVRGRKDFISNITLNVTSEEIAIAICDNWSNNYEEIYAYLIEKLMIREGKRNRPKG